MLLAVGTVLIAGAAIAQTAVEDPYLWLEEIEGPRALAQVREWNAQTEAILTAPPTYERNRARALAILDDQAQIALPELVIGDNVLNHWRDAANPRGLWRIASLDSYASGKPQWRTLIDVDALGKAEGKSWTSRAFAQCWPPAPTPNSRRVMT
jgi:prolyl oligopeptidase